MGMTWLRDISKSEALNLQKLIEEQKEEFEGCNTLRDMCNHLNIPTLGKSCDAYPVRLSHHNPMNCQVQSPEDGSRALSKHTSVDGSSHPTSGGNSEEERFRSQGHDPAVHFLWLGIPEVADIAASDLLGIRVDLTDHVLLQTELLKFVSYDKIDQLKEELGPSFVSAEKDEPVIHQAVMTMLMVDGLRSECKAPVTAEFRTWDWLGEQFVNNTLLQHIQNTRATRVVVLLSSTTCSWPGPTLEEFYTRMRIISAVHGNMVVCPSETEALWYQLKIGDIRAFDQIAEKAKAEFSYRPKTCFGMGDCTLPNPKEDRMVVKRTNSCGAEHVKIVNARTRDNLQCIVPRRRHADSSRQPGSADAIWFHQEYVDTLPTMEFRVFLIQGEAFCAARTGIDLRSKPKIMGIQPLTRHDFRWFSEDPKQQQKKLEELYKFAELVWLGLRQRSDAKEHYDSLRVGNRMDCGVSELSSGGKFFMGECPRFTAMDELSRIILPPPHIATSKALAEAIIEELGPGLKSEYLRESILRQ